MLRVWEVFFGLYLVKHLTPFIMKRTLLLPLAAITLFSCVDESKKTDTAMTVDYPKTKKVDTLDTYFGTDVPDPYRWLENDRSPETEAWVKEENQVTFGYLDKIPYREEIKKKLEKNLKKN